jgi:hypothetical protein
MLLAGECQQLAAQFVAFAFGCSPRFRFLTQTAGRNARLGCGRLNGYGLDFSGSFWSKAPLLVS